MDLSRLEFPGNNAIFHISKGLIFNRMLAFQVKSLFPDRNDRNVQILNKPRLKERLFEKIKFNYNLRLKADTEVSNYQFTSRFIQRMMITDDKLETFKIVKFHLSKELSDDEGLSEFAGIYGIYPLTFVCKKCGDLQYVNRQNVRTFHPEKCYRENCDGRYEQLSLMLFCETCGNIRPFRYVKKDRPVRLSRGSKDSIKTWKVQAEGEELLDVFRLKCEHRNPYDFSRDFKSKEKISDADAKQERPLTVTEGSIFIPIAETTIDIPASNDIDLDDIEYILMAIGLNKFGFLELYELPNDLATIQGFYNAYKNDVDRQFRFKTDSRFRGKTKETQEKLWRQEKNIDKIESIISVLKTVYPPDDLESIRELNDFFALTGKLEHEKINTQSYNEYLEFLPDAVLKESLKLDFEKIKEKYHITNIIHISNVTLISSCYGLIHGINKFYEQGFIPHFEPIWRSKSDPNKGFQAYSYPYTTEGIILTLNKKAICQWLYDCKFISYLPTHDVEVEDFFTGLKSNEDSYKAIKTLLHTLSHLLMRASSIYTGLDLQSYGEKLFPTSAAIFLFSTSSINIGGLQFVYEHEIFRWFEDILFEVKECTLDPNCIKEKGACFSCMYVPEFVCGYFNQYLDRDVFLGKKRYAIGFW